VNEYMNNKILFLVTEDWYFISHRLPLAIALKKNGFEVSVACKDTGKLEQINSYGFNCYNLKINRGYSSLFKVIKSIIEIKKVINISNISIIHAVSIQSIVLALFATLFNKNIKIVAAITGLGSIFLTKNIKSRIIKYIIKLFLILNFQRNNIKVIVQNRDDKKFVNKSLLCKNNKIIIIRGSGVNIKHHYVQPEPNYSPIIISFVGRLIKDKGIEYLLKAFKLAYKKNKNIKLLLVGNLDNDNVSSLGISELNNIIKNDNSIEYIGEIEDIREIWKISHIAILPSKREGLPKSLLEAAAAGRAIITTDVPGCREIALNNVNAKLVKFNDVNQLMIAILYLSINHKIRKSYGLKSRELVESDMSENVVIENTLSLYKNFN